MFKGTNATGTSRPQEMNSPDRLNRIVDGTSIEGEIRSESNIRIDGKVKGIISTKGRLVVGPTGIIDGDVTCHDADIEGKITGTLIVKEILTLKSTAKIDGRLTTGKLAVEPGAVLNASVDMGGLSKPKATTPKATPNVKPVTTATEPKAVEPETV